VIPPFDSRGNLPAGIHATTWELLMVRYGYTQRRLELLNGLRMALFALKTAGCQIAWIDGSFITNKLEPNDIDVIYDDAIIDWDALERIEPVLLEFDNHRRSQKQNLVASVSQQVGSPHCKASPSSSFFNALAITKSKASFDSS
jgi:hypothetical protein